MLFATAYSVQQHEVRYDTRWTANQDCNVTITPDEDMEDVKVYYRLDGFYGSHKDYAGSRSYTQLRGESISDTDAWSPVRYNRHIDSDLRSYLNNTLLTSSNIAYPWGLAAKNVYNDTLNSITYEEENTSNILDIPIDKTDIALSVDKDSRFSNVDGKEDEQWINMEDESFMVWMQIELFSNFKKLHGKINRTLKKGTQYTFNIYYDDKYDQSGIERYIVLSTTSVLGEDKVLGWIFFFASLMMISLSIAMVYLEYLKAKGKLPYQKKNRYQANSI